MTGVQTCALPIFLTVLQVKTVHGLKAPFDALPMEDGSVLEAEIATGNITRASGADCAIMAVVAVVASGLNGPVQMTPGREGALYVTKRPARSRASTCRPVRRQKRPAAWHCPKAWRKRRGAASSWPERPQADRDRTGDGREPHRGRQAAHRRVHRRVDRRVDKRVV